MAVPVVSARAASLLLLLLPVLLVATADPAAATTYRVRPGETLSEIAVRVGTSADALARENGLGDPDRIVAGRVLRVPAGASRRGAAVAAPAGVHTVRAGENLTVIARRYGVSVDAVASVNNLDDRDRIRAGERLAIPAGASLAPPSARASGARATLGRRDVGRLLATVAAEYGWRPDIVKAVAWQESGWSNTVVSSAGAVGIMQVLPATGAFVSRSVVGRDLDLRDPADNVRAGVAFLDFLHGATGGDVRRTLAGYYQGLASVKRNGVHPSTERYIDDVLALRRRF